MATKTKVAARKRKRTGPKTKRYIGIEVKQRQAYARAVGERIKTLREAAGLSQREVASPGCTYAFISRIERGDRVPSFKALQILSVKLNTTPLYLMTGDYMADCPCCGRVVY